MAQGTDDGNDGGPIFTFATGGATGDNDGGKPAINSSTIGAVNPANDRDGGAGGNTAAGAAKRGRGRPKGSGNKTASGASATKEPLDLSFVQFALVGIHSLLAGIAKAPELELADAEVTELAKSIQNVAQYYNLPMNAKTQAWMALVMTGAGIYGPRAIAIFARMKSEQAPPQGAASLASITPFPNAR